MADTLKSFADELDKRFPIEEADISGTDPVLASLEPTEDIGDDIADLQDLDRDTQTDDAESTLKTFADALDIQYPKSVDAERRAKERFKSLEISWRHSMSSQTSIKGLDNIETQWIGIYSKRGEKGIRDYIQALAGVARKELKSQYLEAARVDVGEALETTAPFNFVGNLLRRVKPYFPPGDLEEITSSVLWKNIIAPINRPEGLTRSESFLKVRDSMRAAKRFMTDAAAIRVADKRQLQNFSGYSLDSGKVVSVLSVAAENLIKDLRIREISNTIDIGEAMAVAAVLKIAYATTGNFEEPINPLFGERVSIASWLVGNMLKNGLLLNMEDAKSKTVYELTRDALVDDNGEIKGEQWRFLFNQDKINELPIEAQEAITGFMTTVELLNPIDSIFAIGKGAAIVSKAIGLRKLEAAGVKFAKSLIKQSSKKVIDRMSDLAAKARGAFVKNKSAEDVVEAIANLSTEAKAAGASNLDIVKVYYDKMDVSGKSLGIKTPRFDDIFSKARQGELTGKQSGDLLAASDEVLRDASGKISDSLLKKGNVTASNEALRKSIRDISDASDLVSFRPKDPEVASILAKGDIPREPVTGAPLGPDAGTLMRKLDKFRADLSFEVEGGIGLVDLQRRESIRLIDRNRVHMNVMEKYGVPPEIAELALKRGTEGIKDDLIFNVADRLIDKVGKPVYGNFIKPVQDRINKFLESMGAAPIDKILSGKSPLFEKTLGPFSLRTKLGRPFVRLERELGLEIANDARAMLNDVKEFERQYVKDYMQLGQRLSDQYTTIQQNDVYFAAIGRIPLEVSKTMTRAMVDDAILVRRVITNGSAAQVHAGTLPLSTHLAQQEAYFTRSYPEHVNKKALASDLDETISNGERMTVVQEREMFARELTEDQAATRRLITELPFVVAKTLEKQRPGLMVSKLENWFLNTPLATVTRAEAEKLTPRMRTQYTENPFSALKGRDFTKSEKSRIRELAGKIAKSEGVDQIDAEARAIERLQFSNSPSLDSEEKITLAGYKQKYAQLLDKGIDQIDANIAAVAFAQTTRKRIEKLLAKEFISADSVKGVLHGRLIAKDLAEILQVGLSPKIMTEAQQYYSRWYAIWKVSRTVTNAAVQVPNAINNLWKMLDAGVGPWKPSTWRTGREVFDNWNVPGSLEHEFFDMGGMGTTFKGGVLDRQMQDVSAQMLALSKVKGDVKPYKVMDSIFLAAPKKIAKKLFDVAAATYTLGDAIPKMIAYRTWRKTGMAPAAAFKLLDKYFPNFANIPRAVRDFEENPLIGVPFVSILFELARINLGVITSTHGVLKLAAQLTFVAGIAKAADLVWGEGISEAGDIAAESRLRSPWSIATPFKDDKGNVIFFDIANNHPMYATYDLIHPVWSLFKSIGTKKGITNQEKDDALRGLASRFLAGPVPSAGVQIFFGLDKYFLKSTDDPLDDLGATLRNRVLRTLQQNAPILGFDFFRFFDKASKVPENSGNMEKILIAIDRASGQKLFTLDIAKELEKNGWILDQVVNEVNKKISSLGFQLHDKTISKEEFDSEIKRAQVIIERAQAEARRRRDILLKAGASLEKRRKDSLNGRSTKRLSDFSKKQLGGGFIHPDEPND